MKKEVFRSTLLPLLVITAGGILALGICYLLYVFIYNFVEIQFFPTDPTLLPADFIRRVYAMVLLVLFFIFLRSKVSDILKATLFVGPIGFLTTTAILRFYEKPVWAIAATIIIATISAFLVNKSKKPWFYYYAIVITVLVSTALAWPRP